MALAFFVAWLCGDVVYDVIIQTEDVKTVTKARCIGLTCPVQRRVYMFLTGVAQVGP